VLFTRTPEGDTTRLLLETNGRRYELVSTQDTAETRSAESVRAWGVDGGTLERTLVLAHVKEVRGCEQGPEPDGCVTFQGPRGAATLRLSAFAGKDAAAARARARSVVTPALEERLLALAPLMSSTVELDRYGPDFLGLIWPERFGARRAGPRKGTRGAGCAYDATFGFPCSETELRRERARFPAR
jgi:hypothetical protein